MYFLKKKIISIRIAKISREIETKEPLKEIFFFLHFILSLLYFSGRVKGNEELLFLIFISLIYLFFFFPVSDFIILSILT